MFLLQFSRYRHIYLQNRNLQQIYHMHFSILMFNCNQGNMAVGLPLKICEIFFLRIELENRHFAHICNFRPLADERPTTSIAIYTSLESRPIFSGHCGLQFCRWRLYGSIFIRLAVEEIRTTEQRYHWQLIGNRIWEIDWYQNEWPWPLFRGHLGHVNHWVTFAIE